MILNSFYPSIGGVEKITEYYCQELIKLGNDVSIITLKRGQISQIDLKRLSNFEIYNGIKIYRVNNNLFGFFIFLKTILLFFRSKFDLIYSTDFWGIYAVILKIIFRVRLVHHIHGYQEICPNGLLLYKHDCLKHSIKTCYQKCEYSIIKHIMNRFIYNIIWFFSDILIFVSNAVKNVYLNIRNFPKRKSIVIHNGIPINKSSIIYKKKDLIDLNLDFDDDLLLFVGRLIPHRDLYKVIQNFLILLNRIKKLKLIIVGAGPELQKLKRETDRLNLNKYIIFTGILTGEALEKVLSICNLLIMPIIFPEPFSTVVLESMSYGCPVITFNTGGMPEIIDNMKDGYLIEPYDWKTFFEKIPEILSNKKELEIIRRNAINKIRSKFNIELQAKKLNKLYYITNKGLSEK